MTEDEREAAKEIERAKITAALNALAALEYGEELGDDLPYVRAWVVMSEWTNVELERNNHYGKYSTQPTDQAYSTTVGLVRLLKKAKPGA